MGKTDLTSIAVLAGVGILGYGLLKSDFFKGIGNIGEGAGAAVQGLGGGIADVAGDVSQTTQNIADFLNPLGALGQGIAANTEAILSIKNQSIRREGSQANIIDVESFAQTKAPLINIQSEKDIVGAEQNLLRSNKFEQTKTKVQGDVLDFVSSGSSLIKFNPFSSLTNWIRNVSSGASSALQSISSGSSSTSSTGSVGGRSSSSSSPTSTEIALQQSLLPSLRNLSVAEVTGTASPTQSILSAPVSASSFLSSFLSRFR